ncbi:hypothetical protein LguiB_004215 [Lonicera macranthoides]
MMVRLVFGELFWSSLSMHIPSAPSVYANDDGEAIRVFLSIPSVDVPSAPSICVNNDGEASLQGAVRVFLSTPSVHISSTASVYVNDDGKASLRGAVDQKSGRSPFVPIATKSLCPRRKAIFVREICCINCFFLCYYCCQNLFKTCIIAE